MPPHGCLVIVPFFLTRVLSVLDLHMRSQLGGDELEEHNLYGTLSPALR